MNTDEAAAVARLEERTVQMEKRLEDLAHRADGKDAASPEKEKPAPADQAQAGPGKDEKKNGRRNTVLLAIGALLVVGLIGALIWYFHARNFESTDDAFVEGHVIRVDPKVAAYVQAIYFNDNQQVKQGELLVELDPRDFDLAVDRARSQLNQAQAQVLKAQAGVEQAQSQVIQAQAQVDQQAAQVTQAGAQYELSQLNFNRSNSLYGRDIKAISKEQVDTTKANNDAARGAFESAKSFLHAAQANLEATRSAGVAAAAQVTVAGADVGTAEIAVRDAELQLSHTKIYAPAAGRVTQKAVEPGDYVTVNQALLSLVPPAVWVTANFKETQLTHMRHGQPVDIRVDPFPDRKFQGRVDSIQRGTGARFSLLPPENATGNYVKVVQRVPVKITFATAGGDLPLLGPGMSVVPTVDISSGR